MSLPNPPVYPDLDLRTMQYMPLDVVTLRDSDIAALATGDEFRAAVLLWCAAWHQVPASSLPADDANLARYAGYGRDLKGWLKVKEGALRGFIECADGRLYHSVIAEKATETDTKRRAYRERTAKATEARKNAKTDRNDQRNDHDSTERNDHQGKVSVSKEEKKDSEANASGADAPPTYADAKHELWSEGPIALARLGVPKGQHRSMIGKWMKDTGDNAPSVLAAINQAERRQVQDPIAWISRALTPAGTGPPNEHSGGFTHVLLDQYQDRQREPGIDHPTTGRSRAAAN